MHLEITNWVNFLAVFGAVVLTFLAGAEIDPHSLRENLKQSISIGFLTFLLPFLLGMDVAYYVLGWDINVAKITVNGHRFDSNHRIHKKSKDTANINMRYLCFSALF